MIDSPTVLVVDEDPGLRARVREHLVQDRCRVLEAEHGQQALDWLGREAVGIVFASREARPMGGVEFLRQARGRQPEIPVVLTSSDGSLQTAIAAMREGATDFLVKPFRVRAISERIRQFTGDLGSRAAAARDPRTRDANSPDSSSRDSGSRDRDSRARDTHDSGRGQDIHDSGALDAGTRTRSTPGHGLILEDPRSIELLELATRVAASDVTVMLNGESGVGKEMFARYLHGHPARAAAPFVAVNCAAIPENMLEAMLFGYERGAFTGAYESRAGKFEQAQNGTLLLDEISEMDLGLQAKLLRVLQEREVERLGGKRTLRLNVRVIATSNRDLRLEVQAGRFREDLFYRLSVFPLLIPPLRERPGDILPLARHFLARHGRGIATPVLTSPASGRLLEHPWPGNVRELDNVIQRALILCRSQEIDVPCLRFETVTTDGCGAPVGFGISGGPGSLDRVETLNGFGPLHGAGGMNGSGTPTGAGAMHGFGPLNGAEGTNGAGPLNGFGGRNGAGAPVGAAAPNGHGNGASPSPQGVLGDDLRSREAQVILAALRAADGRRKDVAERLGISPRTLRYKLARLRDAGVVIP